MSILLINQGSQSGRRYSLHERTRIGRALDNDIVLADHLVSRYHAEIVRRGIYYDVRDLGSKNGVQVNGLAIMEKRLHGGDALQIGSTLFTFETPSESRAARFSDSLVHLHNEVDEGIRILDRASLPAPAQEEAGQFLLGLGRLFDCESEDLAEECNSVLQRLLELFGATAGSILLRSVSGELTPLVASAAGGELRISRQAVHLVVDEGKAVLTAEQPEATALDETRPRPRKAMIVPLLRRGRVFGALHLERPAETDCTLEELGRLMAVGQLLAGVVYHALQVDQLPRDNSPKPSWPFVGVSAMARQVREQVLRVAVNDSTVLLTGETGTGKELVANALHLASPRAARPFVTIDCSSIPANLVESELFGHEAGAFTGADRLKRGKVEMAEGGTLFLDEIGEMQIDLQPKLLRFIEELEFSRVGGVRPIHADVRIIAATNRNLDLAAHEGRFRPDLLFRLNVMPIHLAPLRERSEDVRPLVEHFAPRLAPRLGKPFLGLVDEAWALLERYPWPGNVRELRHGLERALILSDDGILRPEHFQINLPEGGEDPTTDGAHPPVDQTQPGLPRAKHVPATLADAEAEAIRRALHFAGGNRLKAAQILKIHRNTLHKKINDYGINF